MKLDRTLLTRCRPQGILLSALLALSCVAAPAVAQDESQEAEEAAAREAADQEPGADEASTAPPEDARQVLLIRIDSAIHPVAAEFIAKSLAEADAMEAEALVLEISTPGGLLESTRVISKAMLTARTPVIVYVAPSGARAASAGFFILMSSDVAAMAPGTNTGAAHPVAAQGKDIEGDLGEKVEQDAAANIRSLARQRGRNIEVAESAVVESKSFTADEALEQELIEFIATDVRDLLRQVDGFEVEKAGEERRPLRTAQAEVVEREMPVLQRLLAAITHPAVAGILMALGMLGLYMELSNPGSIFPGVVGAICLILGFYAMSVLPVNYAGVALVLLALVLFIVETQVPSFGLLTLGGAVALILGAVMLFKDFEPSFQIDMKLVVGTALLLAVIVAVLSAKTLQVRSGRVTTGREGLVTERGVVRTPLAPGGKVFIHGELWNAVADQPLAAGTPVEVVSVDGMTLHVRSSGTEPRATI